jgi:hypothetical protein
MYRGSPISHLRTSTEIRCQPGADRLAHSAGSHALPPPLDRNDGPPLPPAPLTPEPPLKVENLGRGAQADPQEGLRCRQRNVMAGRQRRRSFARAYLQCKTLLLIVRA